MKRLCYSTGRILLSLIFLGSALTKITDPVGTQEYMAAFGLPLTNMLFVGAVATELLGGLSLLLGLRVRWSAAVLITFLLAATLIFHTNLASQEQLMHLLKNLAIMGGLTMVFAHGAGPVSVDAREEKRAAARSEEAVV